MMAEMKTMETEDLQISCQYYYPCFNLGLCILCVVFYKYTIQ